MAFADDLLSDARHLAARGGKKPKQSTLRRAVSTAYYALFHLLIAEFVRNWRRSDQRVRLARMFDHKKMRSAEFKLQGAKATPIEWDLKKVLEAFGNLQDARLVADYDVGRHWSRQEVNDRLDAAEEAFRSWPTVRKDKVAQDHLLSMFGARRQ
jgi:uncharacterized protein (UPF0332 family)